MLRSMIVTLSINKKKMIMLTKIIILRKLVKLIIQRKP